MISDASSRAPAPAAISIRDATKTFGTTTAVDGLNLEVPRGSLCGFLGPNGAGKSTTIRMIMSIIYPDAGAIEVLGANALAAKDRIGYLPEERGLYRTMRVGEYLAYIGRLKGAERRGLADRIRDWLERLDLPGAYGRKCQELSKGMQQKVQFLAAIVHDPELIILDEPFSGLDPVNAVLINQRIAELNAEGRTIIFSTHVLHQAEQICDRIFLIHKGHSLLDASLDEIQAAYDPRTLIVEPADPTVDAGGWGLEGTPGVARVRPLRGEAGIEILLAEGADPHAIMTAVLAAGAVRVLEVKRPSLEEVFVQVVHREDGEQAAMAAEEELSHVQGD